jgi:hypothetical protein
MTRLRRRAKGRDMLGLKSRKLETEEVVTGGAGREFLSSIPRSTFASYTYGILLDILK